MWIRLVIEMYFWWSLSIILHEVGHVLSAVCFHIPILSLKIGNPCFVNFKIGKVLFSPFISECYVEVEEEALLKRKKVIRCIYFLSGILMNFLLLVLALLYGKGLMQIWLIFINAVHIFVNITPFWEGSDGNLLLRYRKM